MLNENAKGLKRIVPWFSGPRKQMIKCTHYYKNMYFLLENPKKNTQNYPINLDKLI
jgi:hypothetical protein